MEEVARGGRNTAEWQELHDRSLDDAQLQALIDRLLDARDELGYMPGADQPLVQHLIVRELVSEEAIQRYYSGMVDFALEGPAAARVGDEIAWP